MHAKSGITPMGSGAARFEQLHEGETRVAFKCAACPQARTLATGFGSREGLRAILGREVYANNYRVRVDPEPTRPHTRLETRAGYMPPRGETETFGEWLDAVEAAEARVRMTCHPKCGADHVHARAALEAAFVAAVDHGRSAVYVPTDL